MAQPDDAVKRKRTILICIVLFCFVIGCMAAFDLGARHTCEESGGLLLDNYVCLINSSLGYCINEDGNYRRNYYNMPGTFFDDDLFRANLTKEQIEDIQDLQAKRLR